jgi:alkylation response protein AidB-like acyl-CoA dehydrogenase
VFIDDVFVPDDQVLGEVNRGWEVSRNTLTAERVSIGSAENPNLASLDRLVELARGGHLDEISQNRAGQLMAEGHAAKILNMRSTLLTLAGGDALPSAAISKLLSMRTAQAFGEFGLATFGVDGAIADPEELEGQWANYLLSSRASTIYGGTSEVQLNIIAERLLGLPRDP